MEGGGYLIPNNAPQIWVLVPFINLGIEDQAGSGHPHRVIEDNRQSSQWYQPRACFQDRSMFGWINVAEKLFLFNMSGTTQRLVVEVSPRAALTTPSNIHAPIRVAHGFLIRAHHRSSSDGAILQPHPTLRKCFQSPQMGGRCSSMRTVLMRGCVLRQPRGLVWGRGLVESWRHGWPPPPMD